MSTKSAFFNTNASKMCPLPRRPTAKPAIAIRQAQNLSQVRRHVLKSVFVAFTLIPLCVSARKPNIIFIFTDDQGYNDLDCFGSEKIKTPHLDQMAEEG